MRSPWILVATATLALSLAGCGESTTDAAGQAQEAAADRPAGKADCPNCDPNGPSAFEQAQLETRWYKPGDTWHVAFQFRNRGLRAKEERLHPTASDEWTRSGLFLFEYKALKEGRDAFGNQMRQTIEIGVSQADPDQVGLGGPGYFESERIDGYHHKVQFKMNDLTEAMEVTLFSRDYPFGHTLQAPSKASLSLPGTIFPVNVPRITAGAPDVVAPALPADLEKVADAMDGTWRDRSYKRFDFENGDVVYWAKGYLWPFYIENEQGRGLLVDGFVGAE